MAGSVSSSSFRNADICYLDLLPEDELDLVGVLLFHEGVDRVIDCVEHLLREWADIVEVQLEGVQSIG